LARDASIVSLGPNSRQASSRHFCVCTWNLSTRTMGLMHEIMNFRLNIDTEYQGWILVFATLTAVWVFCLPCYCAGAPFQWARRYAAWIQRRLPLFLALATIFNAGMMFLIVTWLPDWTPADYIKQMASVALFVAKNAVNFATSIALITVAVLVFTFRDRVFKLAGMDYKTIFRFKLRDVFGGSTRAIELVIWKVEDLPAAQVFAPNNVFVEMYLGYNEPMKTRVHNNAGTNCVVKETIQLNFDKNEDEEPLYIFVKNQKVMGAGELARLEMKAEDVAEVEKQSVDLRKRGGAWTDESFVCKTLIPRGKIWFRVDPVEDEEAYHAMTC